MGLFDMFEAAGAAHVAGQQVLADLGAKQADTEYKQQLVEGAKAQNAEKMQQLGDRKALSNWMNSNQAVAGAAEATARDTAEQFGKASRFAASRGDFENATKMSTLAKGELTRAGEAQEQQEKVEVTKAEALSTTAQNVLADPSNPENHKALYKSAIASGIPPDSIPMPGTPEYATFLNQSTLASMKGKARLEFLEKLRATGQQEKDRKAAEAAREEEAARVLEDRKAARKESNSLAQQGLDIRRDLANGVKEAREAKAATTSGGGAIGFRQTVAAVNYANEVGRGLDLISEMGKGQTANVFGHLDNPSTILKSLEKSGTNKLTPELQQIYQTATKGLGLEMAQLATAGSGRSANKDLIREMGNMVEAQSGDTEYEIMFKIANAADFARVRLEAVPPSSDPKIQAIREKAEASLARYPKPSDVYKAAEAHGLKVGKLKKKQTSMMEALTKIISNHDSEPKGDFAPAAPPKDIQDLLKLYPAH